jgi:hypothetical protein
MDWVKRNLYFLVGGVIALVLMGLAGFYFYSKLQLNNEIMVKLDEQFQELQQLSSEKPHPGSGQVNNIEAAKENEQQVRDTLKKVRAHFEPIPPIPDPRNENNQPEKVTSQEFSASLRRTIDQLQKQATNSSVALPPNYSFSFEAQKPRVTFAAGSLEPLATQLGEVKAICDVLFDAKINSLDNLRRERVSADDSTGPQTDYLEQKSITNELAILSTYEISFRCFSPELASVLAGFASSPHGIMVKTINVETAAPGGTDLANPEMPGYAVPGAPAYAAPTAQSAEAAFARRYGVGGGAAQANPEASMAARYGGAQASRGGIALRPLGVPGQPAAPAYNPPPAYGAAQPGAAPQRGGLPTVLDERQLKITMTIQIIKLLPGQGEAKPPVENQPAPEPQPAP